MALQNDLVAAWRALDGDADTPGWRTIPIASRGRCRLLAGRHFPGSEEALLVGFASIEKPATSQLPQGVGFTVSATTLSNDVLQPTWIALSRQRVGSSEMFALMAVDIVSTLDALEETDDRSILRVFLARIRAWQDFMRRGNDGVLGAEAEIGLFGELEFLLQLITSGFPADLAIQSWRGPLDGVQDFSLGGGAIEVKTTVQAVGFPVTIGTLAQLDDSLVHPLFLGAVRLTSGTSGITLPNQVARAREVLKTFGSARALLDSLLVHAGYLDSVSEAYTRAFTSKGIRVFEVSDAFPRLTRSTVAVEIREVRYQMDLDLLDRPDAGLAYALEKLKVM